MVGWSLREQEYDALASQGIAWGVSKTFRGALVQHDLRGGVAVAD